MKISLLLLFFSWAVMAHEKTKKVDIICFDYPPLVMREGKGFLTQIIRAGFKGVGVEASFHFLPAKRAMRQFSERGGLILSSETHSPDEFSFLKMVRLQGGLFGNGKREDVKKATVMRGLKLSGEAAQNLKFEPVGVSSYDSALQVYLAGRAHGILGVEMPVRYLAHTKFPSARELKVLERPIFTDYGGVSASPNNAHLLELLASGLGQIKANGKFDELKRNAFAWDESGVLAKEVLDKFEVIKIPVRKTVRF